VRRLCFPFSCIAGILCDEPQIVRLVRACLEEAGFRVVTASDGEQALYVARHEAPDLVVM